MVIASNVSGSLRAIDTECCWSCLAYALASVAPGICQAINSVPIATEIIHKRMQKQQLDGDA